jgi:anti-sigma-K factor RskA
MTKDHPFLNDIPAFALGALDPEETNALQSHLRTCDICRAELATYQPVVQRLLLTSSPKQPAARLRRELQRHFPDSQKNLRPGLPWSFSRLAVGIIILLLVVLNIFSITQIQTLRHQQALVKHQLETGQAALALLATTGTKAIAIHNENVTGTLLLNQTHNSAVVLLWNLPELQRDQTYQAWLIDSQGDRTSAGIFQPDKDLSYTSKQITSPLPLTNFIGIGVTVEPARGSLQPTGPRIFKIDF